ncbi:MAG: hypothetical protein CL920_13700 [Deltaproteobacteria bacterium]|nr:hypothetical protein [Deltaproteobacteria bacterium]MBU49745.1 hypothetical protein [Deltaproteobacteria bacterium]
MIPFTKQSNISIKKLSYSYNKPSFSKKVPLIQTTSLIFFQNTSLYASTYFSSTKNPQTSKNM